LNIDFTKLNHPIGTVLGTCTIINRLERKLIELVDLCDNVVCITNWYQKVLILNGIDEDKITYVGPGLPHSNSSSSVCISKGHAIKLMFLGRISQVKGLHLLIEALELFSDSEFELSIYGSSDGTNYEHNLKEKTKGKSNIHWKGSLTQVQVNEEMKKHDLLCLCSTVCEMSPLVIQEARASGLPVLVSNVYGNKEQLEHGATGLMFEMNDITSLQQKLFELIKNPNLLKEMKSNIHSPRSFRNVAIEYLNLYEKIMRKGKDI
jgi:glycosyltransferase involved in cell wall biosynthesis